jgi:hypothetical protein
MAYEPRRVIRVFCACPGEGRGESPSFICAEIPSWPAAIVSCGVV